MLPVQELFKSFTIAKVMGEKRRACFFYSQWSENTNNHARLFSPITLGIVYDLNNSCPGSIRVKFVTRYRQINVLITYFALKWCFLQL